MQQADTVFTRSGDAGSSGNFDIPTGQPLRASDLRRARHRAVFDAADAIDSHMTQLGDVSAMLEGAMAIIERVHGGFECPDWVKVEMIRLDRLAQMSVEKIAATVEAVYAIDAQIIATVKA